MPKDISHLQRLHVLTSIEHIRLETMGKLQFALWGKDHVSFAPIRLSVPHRNVFPEVHFSWLMQALFGLTSLSLVLALVARAAPVDPAHGLLAMRTTPPALCGDSRHYCDSSSSKSVHVFLRDVSSSSASSTAASVTPIATTTSSAAATGPFKRFHAAPAPDPSLTADRIDNKIGVYLSNASVKRSDFLDTTIDELTKRNGTAMVFDVKGGQVFFDTASPMAQQLGLAHAQYDLPTVIQKLHDHGIYAIARFIAIKDYGLAAARPDLRLSSKTGVALSDTWVDPGNLEVQQYNSEIMCDLAKAGMDETNLDYMRLSAQSGEEIRAYTADEKADKVVSFVKAMRDAIDRCGPKMKLGVSTYAILGWDFDVNVRTLGQNVKRFAQYVDVISPMDYPATFKSPEYCGKRTGKNCSYWLVRHTLEGYAKLLADAEGSPNAVIRPWIQGYSFTSQDIDSEIQAVYDAGFCGFQVWNANNNYGPTYGALDHPPARPERCL